MYNLTHPVRLNFPDEQTHFMTSDSLCLTHLISPRPLNIKSRRPTNTDCHVSEIPSFSPYVVFHRMTFTTYFKYFCGSTISQSSAYLRHTLKRRETRTVKKKYYKKIETENSRIMEILRRSFFYTLE